MSSATSFYLDATAYALDSTTIEERHPGTKQDLVHAPNDAIKLRLAV